MNGIFFLLPFVAVASLGVFQSSFAVEQITGYDFFDVTNPDGTHTWSTHEPYVFDGGWVPFIQNGNTVQTDLATVTLNADGSYTWNNKFTDRIVAKYADITNLNSWTYPNALNNESPVISWDGSQFVSSKTKSGIGKLEYKYILDSGRWKTQLEATNLSALTTKVFGFDQIIDLNSDRIKFNGIVRNLDNFDGVTFDREFLENNKAKVLDLLVGVSHDFDLGWENLYSVTIHDTGNNSSQLVFDYRTSTILLPGNTIVIDPTYSSTASSEGRVRSNPSVSTSCSTTYQTSDTSIRMNLGDSAGNNECQMGFGTWSLASIPATATMTSGYIEYDVTSNTSLRNCQVVISSTDTPGQTMYNDGRFAGSGVNATDPFSSCLTVSDGKQETFKSSSYSTFKSKFGSNITLLLTNMIQGLARPTGSDYTTIVRTSDMVLSITYITAPAPDAVTTLTDDAITNTTVDMSWSAPNLNGESLINYMVNYTTPFGTASTFLANTTNTYYNATGLTERTPYSFQVSAFTAGGGNWTGNRLDVYTAGKPDAVTDLIATATSFSTIELSWTQPDLFNGAFVGYQINYTTPVGSPTIIITNNTGTSDTEYEIFGLSETSGYSFRVGVWNQYGLNATGNIANGTTTANFVIGDINIPTDTNPDVVDVYFTRVNNNSTQSTVTVRYPNTATDFKCDLGYQFARTNQTYSGMTPTVYDADFDTVSFQFNGVENEIINFDCYDEDNTLINGRYVVTQSNFPLLDQINNFRNGTYGTMGMFGVVDFITMAVIIFSMIGFNRVNDAVGVIFNVMLIGALAYFEVITVPTIIFGAIAVVLMFAITSTRKD